MNNKEKEVLLMELHRASIESEAIKKYKGQCRQIWKDRLTLLALFVSAVFSAIAMVRTF